MSNRFQVLLRSENGVELDDWLRQKSKSVQKPDQYGVT